MSYYCVRHVYSTLAVGVSFSSVSSPESSLVLIGVRIVEVVEERRTPDNLVLKVSLKVSLKSTIR